jgi:hypothetical protein
MGSPWILAKGIIDPVAQQQSDTKREFAGLIAW